ncbi:MAG: thymidylate synthase (FAD), partial [Spirochaetaceae bacterium]|nr:thymidylate synthase (FAD) [Spirochaetaceae bacterium]
KEIRAYAEVILDLSAKVCPMAFESFNRHLRGGVRFSRKEMDALKKMLNGESHNLTGRDAERFDFKLAENRQT